MATATLYADSLYTTSSNCGNNLGNYIAQFYTCDVSDYRYFDVTFSDWDSIPIGSHITSIQVTATGYTTTSGLAYPPRGAIYTACGDWETVISPNPIANGVGYSGVDYVDIYHTGSEPNGSGYALRIYVINQEGFYSSDGGFTNPQLIVTYTEPPASLLLRD
jgi:hypothetical protein